MADHKPSLLSAASFVAPALPSRPPKRRFSSQPDLTFFTPADSAFNPSPYHPRGEKSNASKNTNRSTRASRGQDPTVAQIPVEPQPDEPGVLFIRAPWTDFPGSESHPDGLTYPILAEHPEWFLDARDFLSEINDDPKAIAYPVVLEPPRGWCPAKKQVKAKSQNGGNPDEPKLRCTFCRRTYLGVNAKSMWRRHVYEKHKIAMANRRDTTRARPTSNKENKARKRGPPPPKPKPIVHGNVVEIDVSLSSPQPSTTYQNTFSAVEEHGNDDATELASDEERDGTPSPSQPSGGPVLSQSMTPSDEEDVMLNIPPSPLYDPSATPDFRHSSPPVHRPWRYMDPEHPMHRSRDVSLLQLALSSPSAAASPQVFGNRTPFGALSRNVFQTPTRRTMQAPLPVASRIARTTSTPLSASTTSDDMWQNPGLVPSPLTKCDMDYILEGSWMPSSGTSPMMPSPGMASPVLRRTQSMPYEDLFSSGSSSSSGPKISAMGRDIGSLSWEDVFTATDEQRPSPPKKRKVVE